MRIKEILERYKKGDISLREAEEELKLFSIKEIENFAKFDINRDKRVGIPEIVLGEGKTIDELIKLCESLIKIKGCCIVTRLDKKNFCELKRKFKEFLKKESKRAGILVFRDFDIKKTGGRIAIVTAGTSDIPRAEEARIVAEELGCDVFCFFDVGVAGIHRILGVIQQIVEKDVDAIIVVAGREGALPTIIAGTVDIPVIGLPTSIGYGLGGKGEASIYAMLQSCSVGLAVVNIDNGVGAGAFAALIANRVAKFREKSPS